MSFYKIKKLLLVKLLLSYATNWMDNNDLFTGSMTGIVVIVWIGVWFVLWKCGRRPVLTTDMASMAS